MSSNVVSAIIRLRLPVEPWQLGEGGDHMDKYLIAENICRLCKEQNMSVESLAEAIGKSVRQVNRYRNGQCETIPSNTLEAIAEALHTNVVTLIT